MQASVGVGDRNYDLFIAYAGPDAADADLLFRHVAEIAPSLRVFLDRRSLRPGDDVDVALRDAIDASRTVAILVTPKTEAAYFEREEILRAIRVVREHPDRRVVPVVCGIAEHDARNRHYGLGLKKPLVVGEGGLRETAQELVALITGRPALVQPLPQLVDDLERRLLEKPRLQAEGARLDACNAEIDRLVREIMSRGRFRTGDLVAGARLIKPCGSGNFGTIWQAKAEDTGALTAVKVFHQEKLAEGVMLWRFRRSIRAMRQLAANRDAPEGIARIHAEAPGGLAFSMEFLGGGNLEDVAQFGWKLERKVDVFAEICRAVRFAHERGVIHRDIKPANVVMNAKGRPVLTDFDIADVKFVTRLSTTAARGGLGTPVFAAPEQLEEGDNATERSDVYSLGRLLYYLLLERSPGFQIERDPSLALLADSPVALLSVVRQATQFDPARRYASVTEMLRDVERYGTWTAAIQARLRASMRWMRRHAALLIILALMAGSGIGGVLYQSSLAERDLEMAKRERSYSESLDVERAKQDGIRARLDEVAHQQSSAVGEVATIQVDLGRLLNELGEIKASEAIKTKAAALRARTRAVEERLATLETQRQAIDAQLRAAVQANPSGSERGWPSCHDDDAMKKCFPADTPIDLAEWGLVPISELRPGMWVRTARVPSLEPSRGFVVDVWEHEAPSSCTVNGIRMTLDEPLWTPTGWTRCEDLAVGARVMGATDDWVEVVSHSVEDGPIRVFGARVEPDHDLFAGGLLAHNKVCEP